MAYPAAVPSTVAPAKKKRSGADKDRFLKLARDRFKQAQEATDKQRQRELDDIAFYNLDQWPEPILDRYKAVKGTGGMPDIPARPHLTIDQTRPAVNTFLNQIRNSEIGVELIPADDFGQSNPISEKEIELREGLVRRIQREPEAEDASLWGASRGIIAGQGYWGVLTRYVPGKSFDQDIYVCRFFNQSSVSLDPAHEQPDGSDAEWGFWGTDLPWAEYTAEYGKVDEKANPIVLMGDDAFRALGEQMPGWFTISGKTRACRVVNYWFMEHERRELLLLADGTAAWADEAPDGAQAIDRRSVDTKSVKWAKIDGYNILSETDWPGKYIPIVKFVANELHPDGSDDRRVDGVVRPMRGSQEGLNYMVSKQVESVALSPVPPWVVVEGTTEGYEEWWKQSNQRPLPYLPYKQTDLEGRQAPPPHRPQLQSGIQDIANSVTLFKEAIQDTSGAHDPTLGKTDPTLRSGKAIQLIQNQDQQGTSQYASNYGRSKRHEGRIINDLLYAIYGSKPGRLARIVNGQGEAQTVRIAGPAQPMRGAQPGHPTPDDGQYRLTPDADFNIVVKVTKAFETRRQEEYNTFGQLIQAEPQLMAWFGDLFFKSQDGPGHTEAADRAKVMLAPPIQALLQSKEQGQQPPSPREQQLQAQLQHVTGIAQQLLQAQAADTAKYQAQMQIEQMKLQTPDATQIRIAEMNNAAKVLVARITAAKQAADTVLEAQEEQIALQHEATQSHLDRQHEAALAAQQHAQQLEQGQQQAANAQQQQAADQAHQADMQQQAQAAQAQQPSTDQTQGGQ